MPLDLLLIVAAVGFFLLLHRRKRGQCVIEPESLIDEEDAEAALLASLAEVLRDGGDPRKQVTAAYHRLLTALAEVGAPRQVQEAPHEHLYRTLGSLGVRPEPLHRLTGLYVIAQFSERPLSDRHRIAAVEALEVSLASLRRLGERPSTVVLQSIPSESTP
jgi:hypothetical protein